MATTKKRGFATMSAARQREIASKGGRVAHEKGTAHEFTREEARKAGRKGGRKTSVQQAPLAPLIGAARPEDTTIASQDEAWICSCVRPLPA